ncbi:hypothetical protein CHS0354_024315 [Potamilus streckersoni]|uniref:Uncharacterized protein n=1 Tax=Potamilus streckersoni TaxID=2493646 RepID=A0AAE0RNF9_9BIVA|nr:hypothetical protein CHS0354_024315 [Potamilus streckersoni]
MLKLITCLQGPISESLKPQKYKSKCLSDAVSQLIISSPILFLFGSAHSKIPRADLVKESRPTKVETHLLDEIPSLDYNEKKHKLFGAICTIRIIETQKGKETLLKLKSCIGVENILFFVDAKYEPDKDLVVNNLEILRSLLKQKMNVIYQSEMDLSTAISNHLEQKFINAFHLLNEYLIEATKKTRHPCGCIFGHEDAKDRLATAIIGFLRTPLTILDLLLTIEPTSSEKFVEIDKVIKIAIVRVTKTILTREIVSICELKGFGVTEYLRRNKVRRRMHETFGNNERYPKSRT